jgi:hypothetical protein
MPMDASLTIKDIAQISQARLSFGDLTVLVGPRICLDRNGPRGVFRQQPTTSHAGCARNAVFEFSLQHPNGVNK